MFGSIGASFEWQLSGSDFEVVTGRSRLGLYAACPERQTDRNAPKVLGRRRINLEGGNRGMNRRGLVGL